jgi:DNA-binding response OmpR family regulator
MPDVNGFELIERIKSDPRYSDIPVIFLTAQKDKKSIIKGMSLGAADFVTKPFSDEKLIECIECQFDADKRKAHMPIILAIDDNPSILQALNSLLSNQYAIYTMPGIEREQPLIDFLRRITPDLFLLDYNMPVLTGFDLVPIIRNLEGHDETPIIFLTSEGSVDNISVAIHLGACDFITKPIDEAVLRERLATHLSDYVMRRRIRSLEDL